MLPYINMKAFRTFKNVQLEHVSEILVLKLSQIPHARFVTGLLVGRAIFRITVSIRQEQVDWVYWVSTHAIQLEKKKSYA